MASSYDKKKVELVDKSALSGLKREVTQARRSLNKTIKTHGGTPYTRGKFPDLDLNAVRKAKEKRNK